MKILSEFLQCVGPTFLVTEFSFFSRHGAWLTFGNVDLHLIKGRPAVHSDDDLIVSHIAITVSDMDTIREKLKSLGCPYRTNISVPNPSDTDTGRVEQAFVRDPDGYYIEFCNCEKLEKFLQSQMTEHEKKWDLSTTTSVMTLSPRLRRFADNAKQNLHPSDTEIKRVSKLKKTVLTLSCDFFTSLVRIS